MTFKSAGADRNVIGRTAFVVLNASAPEKAATEGFRRSPFAGHENPFQLPGNCFDRNWSDDSWPAGSRK
ncbi:MAG TPA: hypothetical protein VLW55_04175 [Burkholderiaceae bacterium]|nr:hypothetical protein [Burkholderiaceae bacterium]